MAKITDVELYRNTPKEVQAYKLPVIGQEGVFIK